MPKTTEISKKMPKQAKVKPCRIKKSSYIILHHPTLSKMQRYGTKKAPSITSDAAAAPFGGAPKCTVLLPPQTQPPLPESG